MIQLTVPTSTHPPDDLYEQRLEKHEEMLRHSQTVSGKGFLFLFERSAENTELMGKIFLKGWSQEPDRRKT